MININNVVRVPTYITVRLNGNPLLHQNVPTMRETGCSEWVGG